MQLQAASCQVTGGWLQQTRMEWGLGELRIERGLDLGVFCSKLQGLFPSAAPQRFRLGREGAVVISLSSKDPQEGSCGSVCQGRGAPGPPLTCRRASAARRPGSLLQACAFLHNSPLRGLSFKTLRSLASVRGFTLRSSCVTHHHQARKSWRTGLLPGWAEALWSPAQPITPVPHENLFTSWSIPKERTMMSTTVFTSVKVQNSRRLQYYGKRKRLQTLP